MFGRIKSEFLENFPPIFHSYLLYTHVLALNCLYSFFFFSSLAALPKHLETRLSNGTSTSLVTSLHAHSSPDGEGLCRTGSALQLLAPCPGSSRLAKFMSAVQCTKALLFAGNR